MNVDFSKEDLNVIKIYLSKAELTTRVEIHHAKSFEFKNILKEREQQVVRILQKIDGALSSEG